MIRPERIYVYGNENTPYGLFAMTPFTVLGRDTAPKELGREILKLLGGIPEAINEVDLRTRGQQYREHLRTLGFRSADAFEKNAISVSVQVRGDRIAVIPHREHPEGGFVASAEETRLCGPNPAEIGALVLQYRGN